MKIGEEANIAKKEGLDEGRVRLRKERSGKRRGRIHPIYFAPTLTQRIAWRTWREVGCPGLMSSKPTTGSCFLSFYCKIWAELKEKGRKMRHENKRKRIRKRMKCTMSCLLLSFYWWSVRHLLPVLSHINEHLVVRLKFSVSLPFLKANRPSFVNVLILSVTSPIVSFASRRSLSFYDQDTVTSSRPAS